MLDPSQARTHQLYNDTWLEFDVSPPLLRQGWKRLSVRVARAQPNDRLPTRARQRRGASQLSLRSLPTKSARGDARVCPQWVGRSTPSGKSSLGGATTAGDVERPPPASLLTAAFIRQRR